MQSVLPGMWDDVARLKKLKEFHISEPDFKII